MLKSLLLFAVLGFTKAGPITINVDTQDGATISGTKTFSVTVQSDSTVREVEFYVNNDLKSSGTSTPYTFDLDTIGMPDGPLSVSFIAYTTEGGKEKKTLNLTIDNGMAKGAAFHVAAANDFLTRSKWADAIREARIALTVDKNDNGARLAMARAFFGQGVLDKAQKFAGDVLDSQPSNKAALSIMSAINLKQAFETFDTNKGNSADTLNLIKDALKGAVDSRAKVLSDEMDSFGAVTPANVKDYAALTCRAGRFSLAIGALQPLVQADPSQLDLSERLAYAQMRYGRYQDALDTLAKTTRTTPLDAYGLALQAELYAQTGQDDQYEDAMKSALLSDNEDLGVRTARAYVALLQNKTGVLAQDLSDLARDQGQRTEVNYLLSALSFRVQRYDDARNYFENAVLAEPLNDDMYVEYANQDISVAQYGKLDSDGTKHQYASAGVLFDTALEARPDSPEALTGKALLLMITGDNAGGLKFAEAATQADPSYAAGWYAYSAALSANNMSDRAQKAMNTAGKLDQAHLDGLEVPKAVTVWVYYETFGRPPIITPPGTSVSE